MTTQALPRRRTNQLSDRTEEVAQFVREQISAGLSEAGAIEVSVVALSAKSPVVHALRTAYNNDMSHSVRLRLILATMPENDPVQEMADLAPIEVRWAANPRFLDAHEQLVIGESASWTGDCMRRDPEKRDAYQSFNSNCLEATGWARISFERLWGSAEPLAVVDASEFATSDRDLPQALPITYTPAEWSQRDRDSQ